MRHGAQVKLCSSDECTNYAVKGGVCMRHGAKAKLCSSEGCSNKSQKGGVCYRHGAKRKLCKSVGCTNQVITGGVCWRHGANKEKKRCFTEGVQIKPKRRSVHKAWSKEGAQTDTAAVDAQMKPIRMQIPQM